MKAYNIYYHNERLNNKPMSKEDLYKNVLNGSNEYIYKRKVFGDTSNIIKINVKDLKIVECIIV